MSENLVGDKRFLKALDSIERAGLNTAPAMALIATRWNQLTRLQFRNRRDPYGASWKPVLRPGQPLRDTGILLQSLHSRASKDKASVGTNICYAIVHQTGATVTAGKPPHMSLCGYQTKGAKYLRFRIGKRWVRKKKVKIPKRQIYPDQQKGLPPGWQEDAADILLDHLRSGLKK